MSKRFSGAFRTIVNDLGANAPVNPQRYKPLTGNGKPLWEFKEHDHRLYCFRRPAGEFVDLVLFNGWVKDKDERAGEQERREIQTAKALLQEYLNEIGGRA